MSATWQRSKRNSAPPWTGAGSSPFLADIQPSRPQLADAIKAAKEVPLRTLLHRFPTLAIWAVLYPLSRNYGAETKDVYLHISRFVGEDYSDVAARDELKSRFRSAARELGVPVHGNDPTALFFPPLGPARSQHADLAQAFVGMALHIGPPAIEDTSAARTWQRRAVVERCPGHPRLREAIYFDVSAHCARRFEAWRQGSTAQGEAEESLFAAYDHAAGRLGRSRSDLVGPPRLFWIGDRLGLEAERSRHTQMVQFGAFPIRASSGQRMGVPAPWPDHISWQAGMVHQHLPFAPGLGEALVFDADSGFFLGRVAVYQEHLEVAAERLVVLSRSEFSSASFGPGIPSKDPQFRVAWVGSRELIAFADKPNLTLSTPRENAIWIDGSVLGRDGARALYACDGELLVQVNPEIGGALESSECGDTTRFGSWRFRWEPTKLRGCHSSNWAFRERVSRARQCSTFWRQGPPAILNSRAEISTRAWIWPGVRSPRADLAGAPVPRNFDAARSAGLRVDDDRISIDARSDVETPVLGLRGADRVHEFMLAARSEKLWHCRILEGDRAFVPRGATLVLGHDNRHDTLLLRSPDREATLILFGREKRRAFFQRQVIEIGAGELEQDEGGDDRIALRRKDGRVELLARVRRSYHPNEITIEEGAGSLHLRFVPRSPFEGIRVPRRASCSGPYRGRLLIWQISTRTLCCARHRR